MLCARSSDATTRGQSRRSRDFVHGRLAFTLGSPQAPTYSLDMIDRHQQDGADPSELPLPDTLEQPDPMSAQRETPREVFSKMDSDLIRVLEDLAFVLIEQGLITLGDLPPQAQNKLLERRSFRDRFQAYRASQAEIVDVLDDSDFGLLR